jgi:hypothetical protein
MNTEETITLPADPGGKNDSGSARAEKGLRAFAKAVGYEPETEGWETVVSDFLVDLGHFCDRQDVYLQDQLQTAKMHYEAETDPEAADCDEGEPDPDSTPGTQFDFI